jgi:hypothetical protein
LNASGTYGNNSYLLSRSSSALPSARFTTMTRDTTTYGATNANTSISKAPRSSTPKATVRRSDSVDKLRPVSRSTSASGGSPRGAVRVDTQLRPGTTTDRVKMNINSNDGQLRTSTSVLSSSLRPGTPSRIWR